MTAPHWRTVAVPQGSSTTLRITEFASAESGEPPVVLLHGIASATVLAAPLLPAFRKRHVIAVDWPGHGLSGTVRVPPGHGIRKHATAILDSLFDRLGHATVDLVGHSLGAQFALYAAHDLAHRVRRVITFGAPGAAMAGVRPPLPMRMLAVRGLGPQLLRIPMSDRAFRRSSAMALGPGVMEAQSPRLYRAARLVASRRANATGTASMFHALLSGGKVRPGVVLSSTELSTISQPVLMVWGDRDVFLSPEAAAPSIAALQNVTLERAPTGHAPWLERPAWARTIVSDFLAETSTRQT